MKDSKKPARKDNQKTFIQINPAGLVQMLESIDKNTRVKMSLKDLGFVSPKGSKVIK